jgi:hypothetical protein
LFLRRHGRDKAVDEVAKGWKTPDKTFDLKKDWRAHRRCPCSEKGQG